MTIPIIGEEGSMDLGKKKIGICVQQRQKSKRLFEKWKAKIGKFNMTEHVLTRCIMARNQILATKPPFNIDVYCLIPKGDKELRTWLIKKSYRMYEGPEEDVLKRYLQAASEFALDYIVRVTGDCPQIDFRTIARITMTGFIGHGPNKPYDYYSNCIEGFRSAPDDQDCEFISKTALEYFNRNATGDDRNHVTGYLTRKVNRKNIGEFAKTLRIGIDPVNKKMDIKHSVDTKEELENAQKRFKQIDGLAAEIDRMYSSTGLNKQ